MNNIGTKVQSGEEMLNEFFENILNISGVDSKIAKTIGELYKQDKLTDTNLKNELQQLRDNDDKD